MLNTAPRIFGFFLRGCFEIHPEVDMLRLDKLGAPRPLVRGERAFRHVIAVKQCHGGFFPGGGPCPGVTRPRKSRRRRRTLGPPVSVRYGYESGTICFLLMGRPVRSGWRGVSARIPATLGFMSRPGACYDPGAYTPRARVRFPPICNQLKLRHNEGRGNAELPRGCFFFPIGGLDISSPGKFMLDMSAPTLYRPVNL